MRSVTTLFELSPAQIEEIFALSADLKQKLARGIRESERRGGERCRVLKGDFTRTADDSPTGREFIQLGVVS